MNRVRLVSGALGLGLVVGLTAPHVPNAARGLFGLFGWASQANPVHGSAEPKHDAKDRHGHGAEGEPEGAIEMTQDRIQAAKIGLARANGGILSRRLSVPATVVPDRNRVGRVAAKVVGTVAELRKGLGDAVSTGEVIAVLESREVADAKSEFVGALVNFGLQKTLFEREQVLWEKQVTAEQRLLKARTTFSEAQLRVDLARQKLSALGVSDHEITALSQSGQAQTGLQRYEIRSPIAGRIVERMVDLGTPVGGEGQAKELYAIADLSSVWVELTVSTSDLPQISEGQTVTIAASGTDKRSVGKIVFTSPILNQDTRSARVIATVENKDFSWRPGSFVTAEVAVDEQRVNLKVPRTALQAINGEQVLFVRTAEGFQKREVTLGKDDGLSVEIISGLEPGEAIAVTNTFLLKAELGKSEAGHSH